MLEMLRQRIKILEINYRKYFDTDIGPSKSKSGAACMRSRIKKDLEVLKLIEYLLMYCPDTMSIDSSSICAAFDKLVEPRELK